MTTQTEITEPHSDARRSTNGFHFREELREQPPGILIVDDDTEACWLMASLLSKEGYAVRVAHDGDEALRTIDSGLPDLILLDVMMPGMNGFELCNVLHSQPSTMDIPVIFLSGYGSVKEKVSGFAVGSVDYITKPVQFEEMLARVVTHLELANLRQQLRDRLADVQEQYGRLKMFANGVAHDLQSPMRDVVSCDDWLLSLQPDVRVSMPGCETTLNKIRNARMHLGSTAESLELLATADAAKVEFGEVDVSVIAEKCVANVSELMVQLNATIRVAPGMPKCLGWAHWIEVAMTHYMTSCLEHVGNGAQLTVFAREAETNDRVRYYIEHEGAPMNEAELQVLSREFAHSCSEPASGIGLDLVLAKHLTQKMGGSLGIENCRAQKSRFYLELKRYITPLALGGGGR